MWGAALDTSLVLSDAHHCQVLVDVIDDKDAFVVHSNFEKGAHVVASIGEVRKLATSTVSLVDSVEALEEAKNIATACRTFMRDYSEDDDPRVLAACLSALRADVGESVAFLVKILSLRAPTNFDVSSYEPRALDIVQSWLNKAVHP